jgi:hypothetical protein
MARIAKTLKNDLSTLKQSCVDKKMKGFKFADCKSAHWCSEMEDFIGQEGEIIAYNEAWNYFTVKFTGDKGYWAYPATKALKHIVEEPKVSDEDLVTVQEIIDETYIAMLKADIEDLSTKLDQAYKEQEQMLDELREWINAFPGAFAKLVSHVGQITEEDVIYHTGIVLRVMEHKFGYKPKSEEI